MRTALAIILGLCVASAAADTFPVRLRLSVGEPVPVHVGDVLTIETRVCIPTGLPPQGQREILDCYIGYWDYPTDKLAWIGNVLPGWHYTTFAADDPGLIYQVCEWDQQPEWAQWIEVCWAPELLIGRVQFTVLQPGHMVFHWYDAQVYTVGQTVNLAAQLDDLTFDLSGDKGDMNGDGRVNAQDIDPFLDAVCDGGGYWALHGWEAWSRADVNWDGVVNAQDIDGFVELLFR